MIENLKKLENLINSELTSKIQSSFIANDELSIEINENDLIEIIQFLKSNEKSLILASPITGRKHQIRKHFSIMGNPIIGDQKFGVGKANHFFLYLSIFTITISGILKKLYMGEKLNFIFFKYGFNKDNFVLADAFYEVHIYANYLLITLVALHILAVIVHHIFFKDKILKKIL